TYIILHPPRSTLFPYTTLFRSFAVGSITQTFEDYPNVGTLLPAMGYGRNQMEDLRETIARSDAELVLIGTPIDLRRLIELDKPRSEEQRLNSSHDQISYAVFCL